MFENTRASQLIDLFTSYSRFQYKQCRNFVFIMNLNVALTFEVLLYLNSYYFGLFFVCELGMNAVKYINFSSLQHYSTDFSILLAVCIVEVLRVLLARRGNLTEKSKNSF